MPNPWYPHAVRDPGAAAGYTRGHNRMRSVKCHYTVGRDSWGLIKNEGLAQWLVTRDGTVAQYAEADALCYDSGEWNDDGPGIEIEFLDEIEGIFTDAARNATAGLVQWLNSEWGVPLDYIGDPDVGRLSEGSWNGFIAHRALQQSQPHSDWWPRGDWDHMMSIIFGGDYVPPEPAAPWTPSGEAPPFPGTLLVDYTRGHGTSTWQAQMSHRGWSIDVDDQYGPSSAHVCSQFQAEKGLGVDGVVGPITWDAAWSSPVT